MKPLIWKGVRTVTFSTMLVAQFFVQPASALAEQVLTPPSMTQTEVTKEENVPEAVRLLPAIPEPTSHRLLREERLRIKEEKALKEAEDERVRIIEERTKNWEDTFPVVSGQRAEASFINRIAKDSVEVARDADIYPSVLIAQAGLESDWGRSGLSANYNNLFGIKGSFKGQSAKLKTWEDVNHEHITIVAGFRSYPSEKVSILDYAQLLKNGLNHNPHFYKGAWRSETDSYKDATKFLQGRYATDSQYTNKLNRIIERYDLTRFDDVEELDLDVEVKPKPVKEDPVPEGKYKVSEGDTIQLILHKSGLTFEEFMEQNELSESRIHVNQIVNIAKESDEEEVDEETLLKARSLFNKERVKEVKPSTSTKSPANTNVKKVIQKSTFR